MVKAVYRDNTFHLIDPVNLQEGDEVELKILPDSEIKKLVGAFKIENIQTIEEIIESDIFE
ncbi:MAG: antitoxin family protein [Methanoregula sp.]|jgi:predicted DNA-binding antitoxin AbrB/MazE fold protein|nr:antitoxin family protein [Methanoregula sp.]